MGYYCELLLVRMHKISCGGVANGGINFDCVRFKVWNVQTTQMICELPMQNHWVRALTTSDKYLYSGSYQAVKVSLHPPTTPLTTPLLSVA